MQAGSAGSHGRIICRSISNFIFLLNCLPDMTGETNYQNIRVSGKYSSNAFLNKSGLLLDNLRFSLQFTFLAVRSDLTDGRSAVRPPGEDPAPLQLLAAAVSGVVPAGLLVVAPGTEAPGETTRHCPEGACRQHISVGTLKSEPQ